MRWIWSVSWPMVCRLAHTMGRIGSPTKKLHVFSALDMSGQSTGIHMVHAFTCSSPAWLQDCLWALSCGKAGQSFCFEMQWWGTTGHFCSLLRSGMGMGVMRSGSIISWVRSPAGQSSKWQHSFACAVSTGQYRSPLCHGHTWRSAWNCISAVSKDSLWELLAFVTAFLQHTNCIWRKAQLLTRHKTPGPVLLLDLWRRMMCWTLAWVA